MATLNLKRNFEQESKRDLRLEERTELRNRNVTNPNHWSVLACIAAAERKGRRVRGTSTAKHPRNLPVQKQPVSAAI